MKLKPIKIYKLLKYFLFWNDKNTKYKFKITHVGKKFGLASVDKLNKILTIKISEFLIKFLFLNIINILTKIRKIENGSAWYLAICHT